MRDDEQGGAEHLFFQSASKQPPSNRHCSVCVLFRGRTSLTQKLWFKELCELQVVDYEGWVGFFGRSGST